MFDHALSFVHIGIELIFSELKHGIHIINETIRAVFLTVLDMNYLLQNHLECFVKNADSCAPAHTTEGEFLWVPGILF